MARFLRLVLAGWAVPVAAIILIWAGVLLHEAGRGDKAWHSAMMSAPDMLAARDADASRIILAALAMSGLVVGLTLRAAWQRKRAERAHRSLQIAFEHVGVGVMVINPDGRIAMFNARTAALLNLPSDFQPGRTAKELRDLQQQRGETTGRGAYSVRSGDTVRLFHQKMADGKIIETRTETLDDGTTVQSFTDMTNAAQQQRVLTEPREAAEAAMSHEIRTPLNGTLGTADLMRTLPMPDSLIAARAPMVLIAEDTMVNRQVARHMLERLGCRVQAVVNGREAVEAVCAGGIDLVLMDIMMPEMDGLAATRAIRALPPPFGAIPIIGLSANAFRSNEDACRAAGVNGFATKPINSDRLAAEITTAMGLGAAVTTMCNPAALDELRAALGDDIVGAVITAFASDTPATLSQLRRYAEAGNLAGVAQAAHALCGNAATLGLLRLAEVARGIERESRQTHGPTHAKLDLLEAEFVASLAALRPESLG